MTLPTTQLSVILHDISIAGQSYSKNEPGARESLIDLGQSLIHALELPSETIQRMGWAEPARTAHCRIALDLKLFETLKESGEHGVDASELAAKGGADKTLIARILKHLVSTHIIREKAAGTYIGTPLSNALVDTKFRDGITYTYDVAGPSFRALPEYLKSINYRNPTDLFNGPFQFAHKTDLPFFAWLDQNPPYLSVFNSYMSAYRAGKPTWCDIGFYPIEERLCEGFDHNQSDVLLVDVGGGLGHDLEELLTKYPSLPGKLILQDRKEVISTMAPTAQFEATAHDFFMPQLVENARAYYLHSVLHDWGDDDCLRILNALKPALKPGYSRILLNEIVISEKYASLPATSMDQLMLVLGAMKERTEAQWKELLQRAGLKISRIWTYPGVGECLIEVELAV